MGLAGAILKKVLSHDSIKYPSPPPEVDLMFKPKKKKKHVDKFAHVGSKVDTTPPSLHASRQLRTLQSWTPRVLAIHRENMRLVMAIKRIHLSGGLVDCSWEKRPDGTRQYHAARVDFLKRVQRENRRLYDFLSKSGPRVTPTAELERSWAHTRSELVRCAGGCFLLFPTPPRADPAFAPPPGFTRPRVSLTLGFRGGARLGELPLELFTDACPLTCALFQDLVRGDGLGHGYVGTRFYRFLEKFRAWRAKLAEVPSPDAVSALKDLGFAAEAADQALRYTGCNIPAAASWLIGERGSSVFELVNGLPDGLILQTLLKQPQIQRGLLNTRMLTAFIAMVGQTGSASLWLNSPHGSPLLSQISRTYHSEKYCLAVNQFSEQRDTSSSAPSTSRQR